MIILAEAGINHNGNLKLAKKLASEAKYAEADIVKFQTFFNSGLWKNYEFSKEEWIDLKKYCDSIEITFLSTPENNDFTAVDFLESFNMPFFKISSPSLTNKKFIKYISKFHKPLLISTGSSKNENRMATTKEIRTTLSWIPNRTVVLLHCVSEYPCKNPHYERIDKLRKLSPYVGLSDHNKNLRPPKNINVIEKHIMLKGQRCPDENLSLNPEEFKEMVKWLRQ